MALSKGGVYIYIYRDIYIYRYIQGSTGNNGESNSLTLDPKYNYKWGEIQGFQVIRGSGFFGL